MSPPKTLGAKPVSYFLLAVAVFLYLKTFILPGTPIYQGDNAPVFLLEARRMLEGEMIYRDFFQLTLPGAQFLYLLLFKLFGVRAWIPDAMLIALGLCFTWLSVVISRRLMSGITALLPGLLFVTMAFGNALDATHHWYSTLAVMGALAMVIEKRSLARLVGAGFLCGLATCATQSRGLLAVLGLAFFLLWESRTKTLGWRRLARAEACLFSMFLVVVAPVMGYLASAVGLKRLIYCTFTYVVKYYAAFNRNNLQVYMVDVPTYTSWLELPAVGIWLFIHALVPLVFVLFCVRYWRGASVRPEEPWDRLMLVNVTGLASFLAVAAAPNWLKVCTASLPAIILFVWFVSSPGKLNEVIRGFLWFVALIVGLSVPVMEQTDWRGVFEAPVGRVAVLDPDQYDKLRWLLHRTSPSDFFFEAGDTDAYFLLDLRNPTEVSFLSSTEYTRPEQVQSVVEALEGHRVRLVLWSVELDLPEERRRAEDHLGPLRAYLRDHYHVVRTFNDGAQVWERAG